MLVRSYRSFRLGLFLSCLAVLPLALAGGAQAGWIPLGGAEGDGVQVQVLESSVDRIQIAFEIPGFYADPVKVGEETYFQLQLPGESNILEQGMPELPHVCRSVIIPDMERMEIRITEVDFVDYPDLPIIPSKGNLLRTVDPATVPYTFSAHYETGGWFPQDQSVLDEPYILRDYRGQVVEILPFQSEGAGGTLRVARRMVVELTPNGPDDRNIIERSGLPGRIAQGFRGLYDHHFLNFGLDRYVPVDEQGTLLIITHDAFHSAMLPLVEWKMQSGIPTSLVDISAIGNTSTAIKNYIQSVYDSEELAFVLLVGDAAQIATPSAAGGSSDPSYSLLAGSDRYPEIFVGRFSAETITQVETQVERTIVYEKTPMAGADWYRQGTGIASNQGPGDDGEYDDEHEDVIRGKLLNYGYSHVDQIYDPYGTAQMVANALNEGRSIVNYTGHGSTTSWSSTGFSVSHVNALTNDGLLPFIVSVACVNGNFSGYTCFAEAWLRATNNGVPTGAVGAYMSSINQSWNPPMCGQDAVVDLLVDYEMFHLGGLLFNGSCQMMDEYGASQGGDMFLTWHLFGDPSLLVRTKTPQDMAVQHDGAMITGQTEYPVSVAGVEGARCALYADGVLYGYAYTNAAGMALIQMDPAPMEPTTLTLTVTAGNKIPIIDPVEALPPSGPFLLYSGSTVDDAEGGDGDGECDAGEDLKVWITLRNAGVETATGLSAVLGTEDPYVVITVAEQSFEDIPAEGYGTSLGAYEISLAADAPDNHTAAFTLDISAVEGDWDRGMTMSIWAPVLAFEQLQVDDAPPLGNGTGWIGAGETVDLLITVRNEGHANANLANLHLTSTTLLVEVLEGIGFCENIPAGEQGQFSPVRVRVSEMCPMPGSVSVRAMVEADGGASDRIDLELPVGGFLDDAEEDRGWTLGAPGDDASSGQWILADPVGTSYGGGNPQPEDDHTADPGHICFVTGNGSVGGAAGEADVDGGKTTLLTPVFDLSQVAEATVEYWVYYSNNLGNNPGEDYWDVEVTADGVNWVSLEHTNASTNAWVQRQFNLQDFIVPGSAVQLRFIAADEINGSLVEAAVDDFVLTIAEPVAAAPEDGRAVLAFSLGRLAPNPSHGLSQVRFQVPERTQVDLRVYDVNGRLVRTLVQGVVSEGEHQVTWDGSNNSGRPVGSGVYFMRMQAPGFTQVRQMSVVR